MVVVVLARCGVVLFSAYPHGHLSLVGGEEESLGELLDADYVRVSI
jgi:hypothetical protein